MHLPLIGGTAPRLQPPCPRCGFPTPTDARQCADCGAPQRGWGRRVRLPAPPLVAQETALDARLRELLARQAALERARQAALERGRAALVAPIEDIQERLGALVARTNDARRAATAQRRVLQDAADLAEAARWLRRDRPAPSTFGAVTVQRRWRDTVPRQGLAIDPRGRHVALVGGGGVLVVDTLAQRAHHIDATGAAGVSFSGDGRLLRFPDGRLWSLHTHTWEPHPPRWRPALPGGGTGGMVSLATLPHDVTVPAADPRWWLEARGAALHLRVGSGAWTRTLAPLPAAPRHLHLDSGLLVVSLRDQPLTEVYTVTSAPALRWDAWALHSPPALAPLARAVIQEGEAAALAALVSGVGILDPALLEAHLTLAAEGARWLADPVLTAHAAQATAAALAQAFARLLSAPGHGRAAAAEALLRLAAVALEGVAVGVPGAEARLRVLVERGPDWAAALAVEDASDALLGLVDGGALQILQAPGEGRAQIGAGTSLALAELRLEAPDPHAALAALAAMGRDLDAQLAALGEVEG